MPPAALTAPRGDYRLAASRGNYVGAAKAVFCSRCANPIRGLFCGPWIALEPFVEAASQPIGREVPAAGLEPAREEPPSRF